MAEVIADWHKSGLILELETEYGVENTPFALAQHEAFKGE
jgi:polar amino acid transport system substrate-binding protein